MPCSTLEHEETWAGQGPQCHTCDRSPRDPDPWCSSTPGLEPSASLCFPSVGPALPGPWSPPLAPAVLLNRENMVLPSLFPCCSQCFSLRVSLLHWLLKCTHLQ